MGMAMRVIVGMRVVIMRVVMIVMLMRSVIGMTMIMPAAPMKVRRMPMRDGRGGRGQHETVIMLHLGHRKGQTVSAASRRSHS